MQKIAHKRRFKLKIKELSMKAADKDAWKKAVLHVREMNKIAKRASPDLRQIMTNEVKELRSDYTYSFAQRFYKVTISLGPHKNENIFSHYPEVLDISEMKDMLLARISKGRAESRMRNTIRKEFQGMRYDMVAPSGPKNTYFEDGIYYEAATGKPMGQLNHKIFPNLKGGGAVFEKKGTIIKLLEGEEYKARIRQAKKPYDKSNFVGVELEIVAKVGRARLDEIFIEAKLAGSVYVKTDGSIRTEKPEDIPHEITLIAKERDINDIINRVCKILNSKEVGGYVNNSCGLHVHLDMRNRIVETCYKNLYGALPVLGKMVPPDRVDTDHGKRYCSLTCADTFKGAQQEGNRYKALNAISYQTHKTLEIRLHSGSINAMKINNWVNILMAIVNGKDTIASGATPELLKDTYGLSDSLLEYIKARTKKFEDRHLDTRKDHFEDAVA